MAIEALRQSIDQIDEEILRLLEKRALLAKDVGAWKNAHGEELAYRPEREAAILRKLRESSEAPLPQDAVLAIFREIISACRSLEMPLSVAFLGPEGTFCEEAARKILGSMACYLPEPTLSDVFRAVETSSASLGVVPIENSIEGSVGRTLDLLFATPLSICNEVLLPIHHCLLSQEKSMDRIDRVYAHPQALAQCDRWLSLHLNQSLRIPVESNAQAAKKAAEEERAAAIASQRAGVLYGLSVLAFAIEDESANFTRFIVLGPYDAKPSGRDKTSLICAVKNEAGAAYRLLEPLAREGVSMIHFESRPVRHQPWTYFFFIEIIGHRVEDKVAKAIDAMKEQAVFLKCLGSYPEGV